MAKLMPATRRHINDKKVNFVIIAFINPIGMAVINFAGR